MRYGLVLVLAGALLLLPAVANAQDIIFENFDSYCTDPPCNDAIGDDSPNQDLFLAAWPGDGCADGRVSDNSPSSIPFSLYQAKDALGDFVGARNRRNLTEAELLNAAVVLDPNPNYVKGTDENPLYVYFRMDLDANGWFRNNRYVELTCGDDRAPTNTVLIDPALCSEKTRRKLDPAGDGTVHGSIAIGQLAMSMPDLCIDSEQHQVQRLTVYDGQAWHYLKNYPIGGAEMRTCKRWNTVEMWIKTSTIDITITSRYNAALGDCSGSYTKTVTIDRAYTGPFSSVVIGGIPNEDDPAGGCWDGADGALGATIPGTGYKTYVDDLLLQGGEAYNDPDIQCVPPPSAACCIPGTEYGQGTCQDLTEEECTGLGGTWLDGQACVDEPCDFCPVPAADTDMDGDVDQNDFAFFQACFTGVGGVVDPDNGCACLDAHPDPDGDGDIDQDDLAAFELCASGPSIPSPCVP